MTVRVLIIEDEKLIRWSLRQKFESRGYAVTEVENGAEAAEALAKDVYDLVMLDYKLPDTTGLDVLRSLRDTDEDDASQHLLARRYGSGPTICAQLPPRKPNERLIGRRHARKSPGM